MPAIAADRAYIRRFLRWFCVVGVSEIVGLSMHPSSANPYLKTKVLTASPQELRMMLYEGAIRFCRQGRRALEAKDYEGSYTGLMRAQKIVLELSTSLRPEAAPGLCEKLEALYTYIYKRLVEANTSHDVSVVDEVIQLLEYEKQTWQMLMDRLAQEGLGASGDDLTGAQQTAISSLSVDG